MSFFRREAEAESPSPMARSHTPNPGSPAGQPGGARERAVTRIAEGTRITGEVSGATDLLVEGELEGHVKVESRVVVGQGGVVRGQITARTVLVSGEVEGNVRGSERVEVGGSGKLEGDIAAPRVTIAEGAFFKGKVEMGGGERGRRAPERSSPASREPAKRAPSKEEPSKEEPAKGSEGLFPAEEKAAEKEGEEPKAGGGGQ